MFIIVTSLFTPPSHDRLVGLLVINPHSLPSPFLLFLVVIALLVSWLWFFIHCCRLFLYFSWSWLWLLAFVTITFLIVLHGPLSCDHLVGLLVVVPNIYCHCLLYSF